MALDIKGLIQRAFSIPPGGFILADILAQIFDPNSGHNHDGVNSAVVSTTVAPDGTTLAITGTGAAARLGVKAGGVDKAQLAADVQTMLVTMVATAPTTASPAGLYFCTADSKLYFNDGTAVAASAALS